MDKTVRKSRHGILCIIAALGLTAALGGCGKPEVKPTGTVLVSMADNSYSPAIVRVPGGRIDRVHERRAQRAQRHCRR